MPSVSPSIRETRGSEVKVKVRGLRGRDSLCSIGAASFGEVYWVQLLAAPLSSALLRPPSGCNTSITPGGCPSLDIVLRDLGLLLFSVRSGRSGGFRRVPPVTSRGYRDD